MPLSLNIGDRCTHCGVDTSAGSGSWVNRIASWADAEQASEWFGGWADYVYLDGWLCRDCQEVE